MKIKSRTRMVPSERELDHFAVSDRNKSCQIYVENDRKSVMVSFWDGKKIRARIFKEKDFFAFMQKHIAPHLNEITHKD